MHAYCYRSGEIGFSRTLPDDGALPIASAPARRLRPLIECLARLAYDGKTLLVPGVPEAPTHMAALDALMNFRRKVERSLRGGR